MKNTLIITIFILLHSVDVRGQNSPLLIHFRERPPEMVITQNNTPEGPVVDLAEELASSVGMSVEWKETPWVRTIKEAKKGQLDLLLRHSMTKERESFLYPILLGFEQREVYFLLPVSSHYDIFSYKDLYNLEIGVNRGSFYFKRFNEDNGIKKSVQNSLEIQFKLLEANRVQAIATYDIRAFENIARKMNLAPESVFKKASYVHRVLNGRFFSIPKKSPNASLYKKLNCLALEMRRNGRITEIFKSFNVKPYIQNFEHPKSRKQIESCLEESK